MNSKSEPKKPFVSPYLASLPSLASLQFRNRVRPTTSFPGSSTPESTRKTSSVSQGSGPNANGKVQQSRVNKDKPLLSKGNLEKLQLAMKQLSLDDNLNIKGVGSNSQAKKVPRPSMTRGAMEKPKSLRPVTRSTQQEKAQSASNDVINGEASNIPIGDTLQPTVKSILKGRSKGKLGNGKQGWKKLLFSTSAPGESGEVKTNGGTQDGARPDKKSVRFGDKVLVHFIPYESRGSTEWQYNLMMARENVFSSLMIDPRLNSLISDLGLQNSPLNPFPPSSDSGIHHHMPNSRLLRRQNYF